MSDVTYTIDQICELTGVSRRTVRYYVQEGLLDPPSGRGRGGHYLDSHVDRLRVIRSLQERGWTLSSIEKYLKSPSYRTSTGVLPETEQPKPETGEAFPSPAARESAEGVCDETSAFRSEQAAGYSRTVRVTYRVAPGVEITVDREVEESASRKIQEIVRIATTILSGKE